MNQWKRRIEIAGLLDDAIIFLEKAGNRVTLFESDYDGDYACYIVACGSDFVLDTFQTREQAIELCREMEWEIVNE